MIIRRSHDEMRHSELISSLVRSNTVISASLEGGRKGKEGVGESNYTEQSQQEIHSS
jgi:triphosphoribosyl-dephospho-CoA synthetase